MKRLFKSKRLGSGEVTTILRRYRTDHWRGFDEVQMYEGSVRYVYAAPGAWRVGFVIGVDRVGQAEALQRHGADLAELVNRR